MSDVVPKNPQNTMSVSPPVVASPDLDGEERGWYSRPSVAAPPPAFVGARRADSLELGFALYVHLQDKPASINSVNSGPHVCVSMPPTVSQV